MRRRKRRRRTTLVINNYSRVVNRTYVQYGQHLSLYPGARAREKEIERVYGTTPDRGPRASPASSERVCVVFWFSIQ